MSKRMISFLSFIIPAIITFLLAYNFLLPALYNNSSSKSIDCSNQRSSYDEGWKMGNMSNLMGDPNDPEKFVKDYNNEVGRNLMQLNDCFKVGFDDGYNGKPNKHESN